MLAVEARAACRECAARMGTLLRGARPLGHVWALESAEAAQDARDDLTDELVRVSGGLDRADAEEVVRDLRRITAEADDARAHADLAVAFAEMGLVQDALEEAALVLAPGADDDARGRALEAVLSPTLLRPGGLAVLRGLLYPV